METFLQKLSHLGFTNMYYTVDSFNQFFLNYVSNDLGMGLGLAIFLMSIGIKLFYAPFTLRLMLNTIKMQGADTEFAKLK